MDSQEFVTLVLSTAVAVSSVSKAVHFSPTSAQQKSQSIKRKISHITPLFSPFLSPNYHWESGSSLKLFDDPKKGKIENYNKHFKVNFTETLL